MSCCPTDGGDKTRLIMALRAEIDALSHQTADIYDCMDHLSSLKHELDQLSISRQSQDNEFAMKHDNALHLVAEMKGEVERLKGEIRLKSGQEGQLIDKVNQLRRRLEQIQCQIQKAICQLEAQARDRQNLLAQRDKLIAQVDHQQGLKGRALDEIKKLRKDNDSVMKRRGEGEHYIRDLDHENREMQNRLAALLQENEQLKSKSKSADEIIEELERSLENSERTLKKLQMDAAELTSIFDRLKNEILMTVKALQNEVAKNSAIAERIVHGENLLMSLDKELNGGEDDAINAEIEKYERENEALERELEMNRGHVQNLFNQNNQLVTQIELMAEDDEKIRGMLERRPVAMRARSKLDRHYTMARQALDNNDCDQLGQPLC